MGSAAPVTRRRFAIAIYIDILEFESGRERRRAGGSEFGGRWADGGVVRERQANTVVGLSTVACGGLGCINVILCSRNARRVSERVLTYGKEVSCIKHQTTPS